MAGLFDYQIALDATPRACEDTGVKPSCEGKGTTRGAAREPARVQVRATRGSVPGKREEGL